LSPAAAVRRVLTKVARADRDSLQPSKTSTPTLRSGTACQKGRRPLDADFWGRTWLNAPSTRERTFIEAALDCYRTGLVDDPKAFLAWPHQTNAELDQAMAQSSR